jgi:hypothetical protein
VQRFQGDVTIVPTRRSVRDLLGALSNPTRAFIGDAIRVGQAATWPKMSLILARVAVEQVLEACVRRTTPTAELLGATGAGHGAAAPASTASTRLPAGDETAQAPPRPRSRGGAARALSPTPPTLTPTTAPRPRPSPEGPRLSFAPSAGSFSVASGVLRTGASALSLAALGGDGDAAGDMGASSSRASALVVATSASSAGREASDVFGVGLESDSEGASVSAGASPPPTPPAAAPSVLLGDRRRGARGLVA